MNTYLFSLLRHLPSNSDLLSSLSFLLLSLGLYIYQQTQDVWKKEIAYIYNIKILRSDIAGLSIVQLLSSSHPAICSKGKKKRTSGVSPSQIVCDTLGHTTLFDSFRLFFHLETFWTISCNQTRLYIPFAGSPIYMSLRLFSSSSLNANNVPCPAILGRDSVVSFFMLLFLFSLLLVSMTAVKGTSHYTTHNIYLCVTRCLFFVCFVFFCVVGDSFLRV